MRAIDGDALMYALILQTCEHSMCTRDGEYWVEFADVERIVKKQPTIEPERKKGKWERHYSRPNVYADLYWHCSECGYKNDDQYANIYHKFCPNCGADMRGDSYADT